MSAGAALTGRVVLLLRPEDRATQLAQRLQSLGATPLHAPVLAFAPPHDDSTAQAAILALDGYDLVVFTSATGVRAFVERAQRARSGPWSEGLRAAAVGPATAGALRAAGLEPLVVATTARAEGLCTELERLLPPPGAILVVAPEGGDRESFTALRARGARVDRVAFYRTVAAAEGSRAASLLASGSVDAVLFSSPSTLRFLLEAGSAAGLDCGAALALVRRVAIGPVTARTLAAAGLPAHAVAAQPTPESVCAALLHAFRSDAPVC